GFAKARSEPAGKAQAHRRQRRERGASARLPCRGPRTATSRQQRDSHARTPPRDWPRRFPEIPAAGRDYTHASPRTCAPRRRLRCKQAADIRPRAERSLRRRADAALEARARAGPPAPLRSRARRVRQARTRMRPRSIAQRPQVPSAAPERGAPLARAAGSPRLRLRTQDSWFVRAEAPAAQPSQKNYVRRQKCQAGSAVVNPAPALNPTRMLSLISRTRMLS